MPLLCCEEIDKWHQLPISRLLPANILSHFFQKRFWWEVLFSFQSDDTLPDGDFGGVVSAAKPTPVVMLSRFAELRFTTLPLSDAAFDYIACPPDSSETERIACPAIGDRC
jgi:hypothetical protein